MKRPLRTRSLLLLLTALTLPTAVLVAPAEESVLAGPPTEDELRHEQEVMKSSFCADCHPAIYAEHEQSTHGRAFTDEEVRLATGRFDHGECIVCHTPRPIFETGIGMNPKRRHHGLEEGNTCMTCHWKKDYDYGTFHGGDECTEAFDPRVGQVEACASCHRNHGTPYQWEISPLGKEAGRACIDCHMEVEFRPVAVGEEPRYVTTHSFPGSRSEDQLKKAYRYEPTIEGNEVVVRVTNKGTGHNFPTELKQRSVESLIVVRDADGKEISRSRMVFRDPYKRPYGLRLPVNTQIPSGQTAEHRVPLHVADGTVECELHFKLYFPIQDNHPDLARRLEVRKLVFHDVTPSDEPVVSAPEVQVVTPDSIPVSQASPAQLVDLVDYVRKHVKDSTEVTIPAGETAEEIQTLVELFQYPVPEANRRARARLAEVGPPAVPALIEGLGSWDNKTYHQSMTVLQKIGVPAIDPLVQALTNEELYVRLHGREVLVRMSGRLPEVQAHPDLYQRLLDGLSSDLAIDRASAATALGEIGYEASAEALQNALNDRDPDVVRAAAFGLARLGDTDALPAIRAAYDRFVFPETQRDLATALARLGSHEGPALLLRGLDHDDDLLREDFFEAFFAVTGIHLGYDPLEARHERLNAIASLQAFWAREGNTVTLLPYEPVDPGLEGELWSAIKLLGDGQEDEKLFQKLLDAGDDAVPSLVKALKYPAGFDQKRAMVCELLGRIGNPKAVPALIMTLRDPVIRVASWAAWALEAIGDREALDAVQRYERRILTQAAAGTLSNSAGSADALLATSTRVRFSLGEESALQDLVKHLLSEDPAARRIAIDALSSIFGFDLDYDPEGSREERRRAAAEWVEAVQ